jgi:hypothetical protein
MLILCAVSPRLNFINSEIKTFKSAESAVVLKCFRPHPVFQQLFEFAAFSEAAKKVIPAKIRVKQPFRA